MSSAAGTLDAGLKLLTSPPVFDVLYASCSPGELARIAKTCAGAHQAVDNYLTHTLNVNKLLAPRYFSEDEVLEFRSLQAKLQFLISGSTALQLLDRTVYPKSDLDVYTFPTDAAEVGHWLIAHNWRYGDPWNAAMTFEQALDGMPPLMEDETAARRAERERYDSDIIRDVFHFHKTGYDEHGEEVELQLQIIVADVCPLQAILSFHCTAVMNYIAWDHACSLYPLGTYEERRALVTYDKSRSFSRAMLKYASRGFRIDSILFDDQTTKGAFRFCTRFVGDGQCWTVKLDTTGVVPPPTGVQVDLTVNGWELYKHPDRTYGRPKDNFGSCAIWFAPLHSAIFRYRYTVPADLLKSLFRFIKQQGAIEWGRFDPDDADVPPGVGKKYGEPKPPGFTFWDEHLPRFKENFVASLAKDSDDKMDCN
ncbi:hypothetical protein AURDEDRAFT_92975 [Auricularia subglabra TFB-10046 SS5]|nr:hypothetical protein AURDEDRAFT_92975 [Auricularia subglabra TFB-10046 SS5]